LYQKVQQVQRFPCFLEDRSLPDFRRLQAVLALH